MKTKIILLIAVVFLTLLKTEAQNFYGGITGGAVITQYNGDNRGGYNKIGPKAGIFILRELSESWNYQIELIFIQKGSQYSGEKNLAYYNLRLRYLELPLSIQYHLKGIHIPGLIDFDINRPLYPEIGISAAYLLQAMEDDNGGGLAEPADPFKPYDFSLHAGINYYLNNHWIFHFRYSYSFIPVREHPGGQTYLLDRGQYNNVLHFTLNYRF
jgi:hypothetical protein